jgi:hypothetical protein
MQNFLTKSAPGLLAIVTVAGLGYFVLTPPSAPAARAAAIEITSHSAACSACRLPLYGRDGVASKLGPDSHASGHVVEATHQGTIGN